MRSIVAALLALVTAVAIASPARAQQPAAPMALQAQYPVGPRHPVVAIGWAGLAAALAPDVNLALRLQGPRLGSEEALEALSRGGHDVGMLPLSSYPQDFPYWGLLSELFVIGSESLAAAAAITELVMLDCERCQDNLMRRKLVFLGTYGAAPYGAISPRPLTTADSFRGEILATPGSFWDRLVQHLGAEPRVVDGGDPHAALAAGTVTALIDVPRALTLPALAGHPIAFTRLPFGAYRGASPVIVNRDSWRRLSPELRRRAMDSAAASVVHITVAYHTAAAAALVAAERNGLTVADGDPLLQARITRFAAGDTGRVIELAEDRFGIDDAAEFVARLRALYDKYATLLPPSVERGLAIELLQSEIFARLDPYTYGLQ